jgi:imidazolonepropionase
MAAILFTNIRRLVGVHTPALPLRGRQLAQLPWIDNAYLLVEDDQIVTYGEMAELKTAGIKAGINVDGTGQFVLPAWCDSHTHLVFPASREDEFVDRIKGLTYAQIAEKGGGILNSARRLESASEGELFVSAWKRLRQLASLGTGAVEIKSGYGLSVEGELKMLRIIRKLKEKSDLSIKATFLGAHAYPLEYRENHEGYIDKLINEMLPVIAREKLADYVDVFCETGFFSPSEMEMICKAGLKYGLKPKLHVNQLNSIGGLQMADRLNALSVDHLEAMTDEDIRLLGQSSMIGTLLPTAAFFLGMDYQPARRLINANAAVALASDYNPGSSPSGNMNLVVALACIQMKMLPEEAINAATINGAFAMGVESELGSIGPGKKASLVFTKPISSLAYLPYAFGDNLIDKVMIAGKWHNI